MSNLLTNAGNEGRASSIQVTPFELQKHLPEMLLDAFERRIFEDMDINQFNIEPHLGGRMQDETRFYQINEVKHGADLDGSFHPHNMQNVIGALRGGSTSLVSAVCSSGREVRLYMGLRQNRIQDSSQLIQRQLQVLQRALSSNFPGIGLSPQAVPFDIINQNLLIPISESRHLAVMTGIPSLRDKGQFPKIFTQSIDRFVDALRGEQYTFMVLSEPISDRRINEMLRAMRALGDEVHRLVHQTIQFSEGRQTFDGESSSVATTINIGTHPLLATLLSFGFGKTTTKSITLNEGEFTSRSVTVDSLNKTAQFCEQLLDHYIRRLQMGRNYGFWNAGIYMASPVESAFLRMQSVARSLFSGDDTHFEPFRIVNISKTGDAKDALYHLHLPKLSPGFDYPAHPLGEEFSKLATPITTEELSVISNLPHHEVPGLKLSPAADYNLNPNIPEHGFALGKLLYRGEELDTEVLITSKALTRHTFVTGLTGSGKTNTCLALLADAYHNQKINFLVIDPAKTEYRFLLHVGAPEDNQPSLKDNLLLFTLCDETITPFRLNPFEFAPGFPLLTHIDFLKTIFNAIFPMYASMPFLLEEALIAIYMERGWDISTSTNRFLAPEDLKDTDRFTQYLPRLVDLYSKVDAVVASKNYDTRLRLDLTAALKARLGSLMRGGKGLMLNSQRSVSVKDLFEKPVVMELHGVGDDDEKAFIMSLIFVMLYECAKTKPLTRDLRHLTLIEEAHRLLRNVPVFSSPELANPRGKTVEMFTDMMAEMRAYGEGFIIVDQIPSKLVPDVVKGSNLKIIHRLLADDDRKMVGNAMGLSEEQIGFIPRLRVGEAILHSEETGDASLVKIYPREDEFADSRPGDTQQEKEQSTREALARLKDSFRRANPSVFRRMPVCSFCDDPCQYTPTLNDPALEGNQVVFAPLLRNTHELLTTILLGHQTQVNKAFAKVQKEVLAMLHQRYDGGFQPGHQRCLQLMLAAAAAKQFLQAHSAIDNWKAVMQFEENLGQLLIAPEASLDLWKHIRSQMTRSIALYPAQERAGCPFCHLRCRFSHIFQQEDHPVVVTLASELRGYTGVKPVDFKRVTDMAVQSIAAVIRPNFHPDAGYCLLSQASTNTNLLADFRNYMFSNPLETPT